MTKIRKNKTTCLYTYFISYFYKCKGGFGFGRCRAQFNKMIDDIDDIETFEESLRKRSKPKDNDIICVNVINYQLLRKENIK